MTELLFAIVLSVIGGALLLLALAVVLIFNMLEAHQKKLERMKDPAVRADPFDDTFPGNGEDPS